MKLGHGGMAIAAVVLIALASLAALYQRGNLFTTGSSGGRSTTQAPLVPPDQIVSGGPPPDGIPAIDNPKFVPADKAQFHADFRDVIGVYHNGEAKAYPLFILVWHEIVNDVVGGDPVAITYCPLCYSTDAYVRVINGHTVTFGTSGKLYNNNLVMYDRLTKSLWSQIWGVSIVGNLTGYKLQKIPIDVMPWEDWKSLYPNTVVLSTDTGYNRPYGTDPYSSYYTDPSIIFPLSHTDTRLQAKEKVLGLTVGDASKAYVTNSLKQGVVQDSVGGQPVVLFVRSDGEARAFNPLVNGMTLHFSSSNGSFVDKETGSLWNYEGLSISGPLNGKVMARYSPETSFWFSWAAFYPNSAIYGNG